MKRLITLILLTISASALPQPVMIRSFSELMEMLKSGHEVRAVIHYAQCHREAGEKDSAAVQDVMASLHIDTWEFFNRNTIGNPMAFVVFSEFKLIAHPKKAKYQYNYGKVKVFEDNTATVDARYLHPRTFKTLMKQQYRCMVGNGLTTGGIEFYKY